MLRWTRVVGTTALVLVAAAAGFAAGRLLPRRERAVVLREEMILLGADARPAGRLPAGTVLYSVPDRYADANSRFVLHLITNVNDEAPLRPVKTEMTFAYFIKSRAWTDRQRRVLAPN